MIPLPPHSEDPFRHPVHRDHLPYFVHPGGVPEFEAPFLHDGVVHCNNGWLAIRFHNMPTDGIEENAEASEKMAKVPWGDIAKCTDQDNWRPLHDARASLFKFGARPCWHRVDDAFQPILRPLCWVGPGRVADVGFLQLLSRLPRAEVWAWDVGRKLPVFVRFNGGEAILAPIQEDHWNATGAKFAILNPRRDDQGFPTWKPFKTKEYTVDVRGMPGWPPPESACHPDDLPTFTYD